MSIVKDIYQQNQESKESTIQRVRHEVVKPTKEEQKYANLIIRKVSERFSDSSDLEKDKELIEKAVKEECSKIPDLDLEGKLRIEKTVLMTVLGNGPIETLIDDPSVTEIVVQRFDNIVYEQGGKVNNTEIVFNNEAHLRTIISRIVQKVNRQINIANPIVDARLPDGSRVNATIPPVSPDGATLTIRKFSDKAFTGRDYMNRNSLNRQMLYFLERCVRGRITIFVSGGTGTGKTTMLNALSKYIPEDELIITIEDTLELRLQQKNVRRMEVALSNNAERMNVDQKMLVKAALRQRPDRIILGETRDGSIVDLISAMSTGHEGSMSTIHANSPRNMCDTRIPILYGMNTAANFPEKSIYMQVSEAIQVIVQLRRFPDGSRKVTEIAVIDGLQEDGRINVKDVFIYDEQDSKFKATGFIPEAIIEKIRFQGLDFDESVFQNK